MTTNQPSEQVQDIAQQVTETADDNPVSVVDVGDATAPEVPFAAEEENPTAAQDYVEEDAVFDDIALEETEHSKIAAPKIGVSRSNRGSLVESTRTHYYDAESGESKGALRNGRGSLAFGDRPRIENRVGLDVEVDVEEEEASWSDVYRSCCLHTPKEWAVIFVWLCGLLFFLYFFLVGLELLGVSFQVVGGCTAGSLLGADTNPMASLMIGIIATTLLQSSSTTTAIIVSLVSGGLNIHQAIYMVMGANVGTAVTSIIVTLAHLGDGDELERAFAGATVLFVFNILTVIILLPVEVATQYLYRITAKMLPASVGDGEKWEGPIKKIVSPLSSTIIIANKEFIEDVSNKTAECDDPYPVNCTYGIESFYTCNNTVAGLVGCNKKTNTCPAFFRNGATRTDDLVSGGVVLFLALFLLILCLVGLVALLRKMLLGASTRIIYKATNINDYLAILIGCAVTFVVQSSSITTSTLVPLAGLGVLKLEQMYPLTLGANIGTTFTALMAAMVSTEVQSLQVALVHLFFNLTGIIIWYPIPFLRRVPLGIARKLGKATRLWRGFPLVFIMTMFFLIPLLLLGISTLFEQDSVGWVVLGVFLVVLIVIGILYFIVWWRCKDGKKKCATCMSNRQRKRAAIEELPDDMEYLKVDMEYVKNEIVKLKDFAGLVEQGRIRPYAREADERHPSVRTLCDDADDTVSLYQTCRSKKWLDVFVASNQSIGASMATHRSRREDGY